jgi:hypothetical protein
VRFAMRLVVVRVGIVPPPGPAARRCGVRAALLVKGAALVGRALSINPITPTCAVMTDGLETG